MSDPLNSDERPYDVIVWGASGFTGKLVVEYLVECYGSDQLRWAIGGRDRERLEASIAWIADPQARPDILIADIRNDKSIEKLVRQGRVVLTTVGPYALYGEALIRACARTGTHYCDLCGETPWIRRMIDVCHDEAVQTGARLVTSCGFDSIPSDYGVWFLARESLKDRGKQPEAVSMLVRAMKGGASGGTFASMMNIMREVQADPEIAKTMRNPYSLNPPDRRTGPDRKDSFKARLDRLGGQWTAPFIMAGINTRIVRRTNALLDYPYGESFRYRESVAAPNRLKASMMSAGQKGFMLLAAIPLTRRHLLRRVLPEPGEGPSRDARERGFFKLQFFGQLADGSVVSATVTGDRDPGYGSTSKMLAESAVCLATDQLDSGGGCLTPVAAMGTQLFDRLVRNAGMTFTFD